MNWGEIRAWVKELGAPIAMAAFLAWFLVRTLEESRAERGAWMLAHQQEIAQVVESFRACCKGHGGGSP